MHQICLCCHENCLKINSLTITLTLLSFDLYQQVLIELTWCFSALSSLTLTQQTLEQHSVICLHSHSLLSQYKHVILSYTDRQGHVLDCSQQRMCCTVNFVLISSYWYMKGDKWSSTGFWMFEHAVTQCSWVNTMMTFIQNEGIQMSSIRSHALYTPV